MTLKLKTRTQFPAVVLASSPIVITKSGVTYTFSFDQNAFSANFNSVYAQLANNLSDIAVKYTAFDNLSIHGADIASAGTVNLETATGNLVDVTGTTTITAITLNEGHERTVRFTGILTLTNGASLVLPGGANITTAAGDFARFRGYAAGVVRCVSYTPATGKGVIGPALTDITGFGTGISAALAINTGSNGAPALFGGALGAATATTINKVTFTQPATGSTLTLIDGTTLTGPASSGTAMTLGNVETITGAKTFGAAGNVGKLAIAGTTSGSTVLNASATASGTLTLPAATDTLTAKATTDILTNKTIDTAGTGNHIQISGVDITRGQILGEASTASASAGNIGEYVESIIALGSATSLTTATAKTITSISLTAGDWDVSGAVSFVGTTSPSTTSVQSSISLSTNTVDLTVGRSNLQSFAATTSTNNTAFALPVGPVRISISGTTTVFIVGVATFTTGTQAGYGMIRARRVR